MKGILGTSTGAATGKSNICGDAGSCTAQSGAVTSTSETTGGTLAPHPRDAPRPSRSLSSPTAQTAVATASDRAAAPADGHDTLVWAASQGPVATAACGPVSDVTDPGTAAAGRHAPATSADERLADPHLRLLCQNCNN